MTTVLAAQSHKDLSGMDPSSYSLDELKSRLKMSQLEVKITTNAKKSRKSKTPVFRQQRRPSSSEENHTPASPRANNIDNQNRASLSPDSPISEVERKPLINEPPLPPPPGGIKSYSDFMRSLAAKYNNNEHGLPTSSAESPFQPFKATPSPLVGGGTVHPSLAGLHLPFPFLGSSLSSLADPKSNKGLSPAGLPPGFPNMLDIHSTHALLNLARSGSLGAPPTTHSPPTSSSAVSSAFSEISLKRPLIATSEALDLSPPTTAGVKKAKIDHQSPPKADASITNWSVSEVSQFVASIDICSEYAEVFKEHNIDGSALPLLTEDHLTIRLGLKLGPALKLKSILAKKLGPAHADICVHCAHCNSSKSAEENGEQPDNTNNRSASRASSLGEK